MVAHIHLLVTIIQNVRKLKDVGSDHWVLKCMVIKLGGANIIFFDSDFHVIKTEDVDEKNITKD